MGSTFYSLHYHWVCSTKGRRPFLRADRRPRFHEYLGGTIRGLDGVPLRVGGVEDHVHILFDLKTSHCLADFSRELKKASSVWAASTCEREFSWQDGYSAFTVSASQLAAVGAYIARQEEHHRQSTFEEELRLLLDKHGIQYDLRFLL
jgi:putative transposase